MNEELYNKKSLIALLINLAKADKVVDPAEERFIRELCNKISLPYKDLADLWENSENFPLSTPPSERHRLTILYQLINLMKSDGIVTVEEEEFVRHSGKLLHLNEVLIEEFIRLAKDTDTTHLPPEVFVENFKKYLN
jgi:uncharacterized tellurite resistance protein B-like protein